MELKVLEPRLADRLDELDKEVYKWAAATRQDLLFRLAEMDLHERAAVGGQPSLVDSLKYGIRKNDQDIEAVAFRFMRHGIFLERGVGRGRPVGSSKAAAAAKPWLSLTLPANVDRFADILADEYADVAAAAIRVLIPGIIDTRVIGGKNVRLSEIVIDRSSF